MSTFFLWKRIIVDRHRVNQEFIVRFHFLLSCEFMYQRLYKASMVLSHEIPTLHPLQIPHFSPLLPFQRQ